jgi:hypothetical protein
VDELCGGKKVVIFGVPGAFTPGCSKTHLPGKAASFSLLKMGQYLGTRYRCSRKKIVIRPYGVPD